MRREKGFIEFLGNRQSQHKIEWVELDKDNSWDSMWDIELYLNKILNIQFQKQYQILKLKARGEFVARVVRNMVRIIMVIDKLVHILVVRPLTGSY